MGTAAAMAAAEAEVAAREPWDMQDVLGFINEQLAPGDQCLLAVSLEPPPRTSAAGTVVALPEEESTAPEPSSDGAHHHHHHHHHHPYQRQSIYAAIVSHRAEQCLLMGVGVDTDGVAALELIVPIARGDLVLVTGDGGFLFVPKDKHQVGLGLGKGEGRERIESGKRCSGWECICTNRPPSRPAAPGAVQAGKCAELVDICADAAQLAGARRARQRRLAMG